MADSNLSTIQILLIIIIPSLITGIPSIIAAITAKKRIHALITPEIGDTTASAADKITTAYGKIVDDMQTRMSTYEEKQCKLEDKIERQNKRITHLEQGVYKLIAQIRSLGAEPVFTLDDLPKEWPSQ